VSTRAATFSPARSAAADLKIEMLIVYAMAVATQILLPCLAKFSAFDPSADAAGSQGSPTAQLIWGVAYVAAAIRLFAIRDSIRPVLSGTLWLWAFVGTMLLSFVWSVEPHTTFVESVELLGTTIVGLYLATRFTLPQFLQIMTWTFGTIAVASILLVVAAPGHGRDAYGGGAWCGIFVEKNELGRAMALGTISAAALLVNGGWGRLRYAVLGVLALCIALLIGSNSMTATVDCVAVVTLGLVGLLCRSERFGLAARIGAGALIVTAALTYFAFGFTADFSALGREGNLTGRTDFWPYVQTAIGDRPMLGYGYDAFFPSEIGKSYMIGYLEQSGGWSPFHAHNSALQICLDAGYAGVAILAVTLIIGLWRCSRYFARERMRCAVWPLTIVAYLILGSYTETYLGNYNTLDWIFFTAALVYPLRDRMHLAPPGPGR
jgi:O-antigen ligase